MTLGLTGQGRDGGMAYYPQTADLRYEPNVIGKQAGSSYSISTAGTSPFTVGITKNPTKSGLIVKFSGLTLGTVASEKLGNFYIRY